MQEHQHPRNREPVQRVLGRAFTSFGFGGGRGGGGVLKLLGLRA